MFDTKRILDQLIGSGVAGGLAGGLAGGALANALSGKKGRKLAGSALKVGGVALVGGLAYKAWQKYQQDQGGSSAAAAVSEQAFLPDEADAEESSKLGVLLARTMIAAAKADGQIDINESQAILNRINQLDLSVDDKAFLFEEFNKPIDVVALAEDVDTPEHAAEAYVAALLMVDRPSPQEQMFLDMLASAFNLDQGLVAELHNSVENGPAVA
jgi:uncharacterized membrane protein YebE (DUF533 family)